MSKIEHLPKAIPPREIPFKIDLKGLVTGDRYKGDFVVRVPLSRDMSKIGVELAKLNDGVRFEDLDAGTAMLHNSVAFLRILLERSPDWFWKEEELDYGLNTLDVNICVEIFLKAEKLVKDWKKDLLSAGEEKKTE